MALMYVTNAGSGIRSCINAGGERFELVYGYFFFVRNPVKGMKIKISPLITANLTKFYL